MKVNIPGIDSMSKKELFRYLEANKSTIFDMKKSTSKWAEPVYLPHKELPGSVDKAYLYENHPAVGLLKRTIVANTYLWMDSHDDVHIPGIFSKSIAERAAPRIPHLKDHKFELGAKVGSPIKYYEGAIAWRELGVDIPGKTTSLFLESDIKASLDKKIYEMYLANEIDQHSVSMRYIQIALGINDEEFDNGYKVWQSYIDLIGNKDKVIEQGYFYAVSEAMLIETSAVIAGSNELTPTLGAGLEPAKTTPVDEPRKALDVEGILKNYL